jgi:hypothetical protein
MQSIPQPDPDVVTTPVPEGEMVLMHLRTGQYYSLNTTGTLVWNLMGSSLTTAGIIQAIFDRFDVTAGTAAEAVDELMRDLKTHQLITLPEGGSDSQ